MEKFKITLRKYAPPIFYLLKGVNFIRVSILQYFDGIRIEKRNQQVQLVANKLYEAFGNIVMHGPFKGMVMLEEPKCQPTYLCGTYELELHKFFEAANLKQYDCFVNIGCATGYYAVGLARQCPNTLTLAYDLDLAVLELAKDLARVNKCENIQFEELFQIEDLAQLKSKKCFVLCDIEGAEYDLLAQTYQVDLGHCDFLIETHDFRVAGVSEALIQRFSATHDIENIVGQARNPADYPELVFLGSELINYALDVSRHEIGRWLFLKSKVSTY